MEILKKVWVWLVYSTENPERLSLTLKSGVSYAVLVYAWTHGGQQISSQITDELVGDVVSALALASQACAAVIALFAAVRKLWNGLKQLTA